jgi:hydroxymethylglutaryl-CoA lyase
MAPGTGEITERTVLIGLIGSGISLSRTPAMHMAEAKARGLACSYRLLDVDDVERRSATLADLLTRAENDGYAGVNVTYPFKIDAMALVDELSPNARAAGALNTIVFRNGRRYGHNTDLWGFAESIRRGLPDAAMDHVLLIGAGGAGGAVALALADVGVKQLSIHDIDMARAEHLARHVAESRPGTDARAVTEVTELVRTGRPDGLVNATPMGMAKLPGSAFPLELLDPAMWVADVVYFPLETDLLRAACACGCRVLPGSGMAVFQAVRAFELFTGCPADPARMKATFEGFDHAANHAPNRRPSRPLPAEARSFETVTAPAAPPVPMPMPMPPDGQASTGLHAGSPFDFQGPVLIEDEFLRDGLQNEKRLFTIAEKLRFLEALEAAGIQRIQVGSFVHPEWVPQMADTDELFARIKAKPGITYSALVLNRAGLYRALAVGVKHLSISVSASETHSRKNTNRSVADARAAIRPTIEKALTEGIAVRAGIQSALGCGFEGRIDLATVLGIAREFAALGVQEINIADTAGLADPRLVFETCARLRDEISPEIRLSLHLHDTRGLGIANMLAGLQAGVRTFDAALGGLGGCPFVPGATGNIATEDAVFACALMGIETGINWQALRAPVAEAEALLGRRLPGRMAHVPPPPWERKDEEAP